MLGFLLALLQGHKLSDLSVNFTNTKVLVLRNLPTTRHDGWKPRVLLLGPLGRTWKNVTVFATPCPKDSFAKMLTSRVFPIPNPLTGRAEDWQVNNDELRSSIFLLRLEAKANNLQKRDCHHLQICKRHGQQLTPSDHNARKQWMTKKIMVNKAKITTRKPWQWSGFQPSTCNSVVNPGQFHNAG